MIISDTDHYAPGHGDALWAWKWFVRGHHPILMDFGLLGGIEPGGPAAPESGVPPFEFYEPARYAMGDTRRNAELMQLLDMAPRGDLSSTGFVLANPGAEYLVLQPNDADGPFTVTLEAGTYAVEWHSVSTRATQPTGTVTIGAAESVPFVSPFRIPGPWCCT